jgi:hypothetical protein
MVNAISGHRSSRTCSGRGGLVSGVGAAYRFVDHVLGHVSQFAVLGLADRP